MSTTAAVERQTVVADDVVSIKIDYEANSRDPARVFRAMSGLIDALYQIDVDLARSIGTSVEPTLLLQAIETASITSVLRQVVRFIDPSAVTDDAPEPRVIRYLSRGAGRILAFIDGHETVASADEVRELQQDLVRLAEETEAASFPSYELVPAPRLLANMQMVAEAAHNLQGDDRDLPICGRIGSHQPRIYS